MDGDTRVGPNALLQIVGVLERASEEDLKELYTFANHMVSHGKNTKRKHIYSTLETCVRSLQYYNEDVERSGGKYAKAESKTDDAAALVGHILENMVFNVLTEDQREEEYHEQINSLEGSRAKGLPTEIANESMHWLFDSMEKWLEEHPVSGVTASQWECMLTDTTQMQFDEYILPVLLRWFGQYFKYDDEVVLDATRHWSTEI